MAEKVEFGISIPDIFRQGVEGFRKNVVPLLLGSSVVLAAFTGFGFWAGEFETFTGAWFAISLLGFFLSGTLAYPWFSYALQAAQGESVDLQAPFEHPKRFAHQAVATFWFWAGVMLGVQFLRGIPSILVLIFYAFYGYIVAEAGKGGSYALGTSVRLGEKRRIGLFGIAVLFAVFNFIPVVVAASVPLPIATAVIMFVGLAVSTSITLVSGGAIYSVVKELRNVV